MTNKNHTINKALLGFWACLFVLNLSQLNQSLIQDLRAHTIRDELLFHLMLRSSPSIWVASLKILNSLLSSSKNDWILKSLSSLTIMKQRNKSQKP
ncbi:hypothetical protein PanWU01x14_012350 [Parasponia andersonii]|uniref:Uncharacterized protein n=1 Tax=Parasponia andersonii TaxID=3476 RepID=A0A2P5E1T0_PARAD|nr:hypothetical protein PanWU01x14_012350 [Parasponia andersonii]